MYTNAERSCQFTLLHFACDGGLVASVSTMVRLGASTDIGDSNDKKPMVRPADGAR